MAEPEAKEREFYRPQLYIDQIAILDVMGFFKYEAREGVYKALPNLVMVKDLPKHIF